MHSNNFSSIVSILIRENNQNTLTSRKSYSFYFIIYWKEMWKKIQIKSSKLNIVIKWNISKINIRNEIFTIN